MYFRIKNIVLGKSNKKGFVTLLKYALPLLLGFYLLWHFYSAMDKPTREVFFKAVKEANYFWIILSLLIGLVSYFIRAYRWKYLLEPVGLKPKFWHRYHALMIGYIVNLVVPRAGEATRAALLYRTDKIPFAKSFGTIIGERVFDLIMLGIIFLVAMFMSWQDIFTLKDIITGNDVNSVASSDGASWGKWVFIAMFGVLVLMVFLFYKIELLRTKVSSFFKEVMAGVLGILKSKNPFAFIFYTVLIWVLYLVFFGICFFAFEETSDFPIAGVFIGFIAGTIGIMFTNGGIGAYPYLVGVVVTFYIGDQFDSQAAADGIGKALGMIIWLSQTIGVIILGLISLAFLPRNYKKEKHDKSE